MGISFSGVTLWDSLDAEIKESRTILQFKIKFKNMILGRYGQEEEVGGGVEGIW